ncbi:membrane protein insertase YidC [Conyzicola sp.]|uniref:membrane protein insertase YidC n=1 Tax=Conyzicola sp. TaxID=1969404 RepID=UPI00398A483E
MDIYSFAPIAVVLDAAYSVVTGLQDLLAPLAGSASAALAIVLITLVLRLLLIPVGRSQVRAEFTRRRLAPRLQALQKKYKKNPEMLQKKTMELYTSEKASPLAGILPTLAQAPVLSIVYGLFILPTVNGHGNALLTEQLLGVPLGTSLAHLLTTGAFGLDLLVYAALLLVIAAVAFASRRVALAFNKPADDAAPAMARMNAALSWLPFITVLFAALVPLAATLYLTVTTTWTLVERQVLRRRLAPGVD